MLFTFLFFIIVQVATQKSNLEAWLRVLCLLATAAVGWIFNWEDTLALMTPAALDAFSFGLGLFLMISAGYRILYVRNLTAVQKRTYGIVVFAGLLTAGADVARLWSLQQ